MSAVILNVVCFALIIYMGFRIFQLQKRNRKNRKLLDIIGSIKEEETYFAKADEMIRTVNDPEFVAKARVLQLWGAVYHSRDDLYAQALENLDLDALIAKNNGRTNIDLNEDSFFYLYLACENTLYSRGEKEKMEQLWQKLDAVNETMKTWLVCEIGRQNRRFYEQKEDRGMKFYQDVLNGDYSGYQYSKQLIGLYKSVITAMLARLYLDAGRQEDYDGLLPDLKQFAKSNLGSRYLQELQITLPKEPEEGEETAEEPVEQTEDKPEQPADDQAKPADPETKDTAGEPKE